MPNTKKFSILFKIKEHCLPNKNPKYRLWLDGTLTDFITECSFGPHQISIELLNKEPNDTIIGPDGTVLQDLALELLELVVDGIDISHHVKHHAIYSTADGFEKTYGYMHKNGIITFDFTCPVFYYLRNLQTVRT